MRIATTLALIILAALCVNSSWADYVPDEAIHFYAAADGDDGNPGTSEKPVATPERLQELVRAKLREIESKDEAGKVVPIVAHLGEGTYRLERPLVFDYRDTCKKGEAGVTYRGDPGKGKTTISGGRVIEGWKVNADGTWSTIIPEVKSGEWNFRQLWVDGKRAVRAREPDDKTLRVEKVGEDRTTNFIYRKGDIPEIADLDGTELVFFHDWSISRVPVKTIDRDSRRLTVKHMVGNGRSWTLMDNFEKQPRYFLENAREFVDTPGEWHLDRKTGELVYFPLPGQKIDDIEVVAPVARQLISISGTESTQIRNLHLENITFEHTAWSAPDDVYCGGQACTYWTTDAAKWRRDAEPAAIQIDLAKGVTFRWLRIRHIGSSGVWYRRTCTDKCFIVDCEVSDCGANGVMVGETQNRQVDGGPWWQKAPEQATSGVGVAGNRISNCGKELYGAIGIWVGLAAKTEVLANEVFNLPYTGVSVGWMWWNPRDLPQPRKTPAEANIIQANHIHHCMQILSDGGGIYTLGDQPGSKILTNTIHDIPKNVGRAESNGMFLDQGTGGFTIERNLIYDTDRSPIRFHKGWKNTVRDNVFMLKDGVPMIRYNDTVADRIEKIDNKTAETVEEAKRLFKQINQKSK